MTKQAGFTLLELLVALAIFALILSGLGAGTRFGIRATETQARMIERSGDLDAVERAFRRLIAEASPGRAGAPSLVGGPDQVAFTTTLPQIGTAGPARADVVLRMGSDHRLILQWVPHRWGTAFGAPAASQRTELVGGIERLELAYWSAGWQRSWTAPDLPALIRLRIGFPPGDARHWPDVVVATMTHRPP